MSFVKAFLNLTQSYRIAKRSTAKTCVKKKFCKALGMGIKKRELEKIAKQLRAALALIEQELEPVQIPDEVQRMVEAKRIARICLAWGHVVPEGEKMWRGLCEADYNTTMGKIRRGEEDEQELMGRGLLGPKKSPGRKSARELAQPLDMTPEEAKQVAEDIEKYLKQKGEQV